jgi:hypothetical protein
MEPTVEVHSVGRAEARRVFLGVGPAVRRVCVVAKDTPAEEGAAKADSILAYADDGTTLVVFTADATVGAFFPELADEIEAVADLEDDDALLPTIATEDDPAPGARVKLSETMRVSSVVVRATTLPAFVANVLEGAEAGDRVHLHLYARDFDGASLGALGVVLARTSSRCSVRVDATTPRHRHRDDSAETRVKCTERWAEFVAGCTSNGVAVNETASPVTHLIVGSLALRFTADVVEGRAYVLVQTVPASELRPPIMAVYRSPAALATVRRAPSLAATSALVASALTKNFFHCKRGLDAEKLVVYVDGSAPSAAWETQFLAHTFPYLSVVDGAPPPPPAAAPPAAAPPAVSPDAAAASDVQVGA